MPTSERRLEPGLVCQSMLRRLRSVAFASEGVALEVNADARACGCTVVLVR